MGSNTFVYTDKFKLSL